MGVDMKVKAIYDSEIGNITRSEKNWKDVLKVTGQLYRYEYDNIVMVTAQRPPEKSTLMADYDTWKKVGRYVKRGAKGCAIFPSRALNPRMRYIFDISDTGGKNVKLTWDLEGENLKDYVDFLVSEGQIEQYDNGDRESLKNILKQFTGTNVWAIIKEEFGDRMTELMQLSGSVIKEESKKRNGLQQEMDMEQLVYASIMYAVGTRCGFDVSVQEQDFSQIVNIKDEEIIYRLGSIVCDVSCSVLREFSRNLKAIESESILVICQELFKKDFDMFFRKKGNFNRPSVCFAQNRMSVRLNIIFGVQLFAGVQLVFDQQSKNESYKFTRCKRECSFVLMFGYLSIFSGIEISILRDVLPDAVCRFAKIVAKIGISGFRHFVVLRREISGIPLRPVKPSIFGKGIG